MVISVDSRKIHGWWHSLLLARFVCLLQPNDVQPEIIVDMSAWSAKIGVYLWTKQNKGRDHDDNYERYNDSQF